MEDVDTVFPERPRRRERAIALHCSGSGASQWHSLVQALGPGYELLTPEHYGCESSGPWTGEHAFTLADDAARPIALIDETEEKVHLVGHSYGGGVALYVALNRPNKIATSNVLSTSRRHSICFDRWARLAPKRSLKSARLRGTSVNVLLLATIARALPISSTIGIFRVPGRQSVWLRKMR